MDPEVPRDKTLRFQTKGLTKISEREILEGLKNSISEDSIVAIQVTSDTCYLTFDCIEVKRNIQIEGFTVQDRRIKPQDVNKSITNVTLKDLPVEISDQFVTSSMLKYGEVISGSICRGTIKGTKVQTGTRYFQMLSVKDPIPNITAMGKHQVRIFCDNQKTQCKYCDSVLHPFYKCTKKPIRIKRCFHCSSDKHLIQNCPQFQNNHRGGETYGKPTDHELYGDYAAEIEEGRRFQKEDEENVTFHQHSTPVSNSNAVNPSEPENCQKTYSKVIFGASNLCGAESGDAETVVIAKSGACAQSIGELFEIFERTPGCQTNALEIAIMHLGTNDIKKTKMDADQVKLNVSAAVTKIKEHFPNLIQIGISGIPPKRGKGPQAEKYNETVASVNSFSQKLSVRTSDVNFIANDNLFTKTKSFNPKSNYNLDDVTGIHLNAKGVSELMKNFLDILNPPKEFLSILKEAREIQSGKGKRNRSEISLTPQSAEKQENKRQGLDLGESFVPQ